MKRDRFEPGSSNLQLQALPMGRSLPQKLHFEPYRFFAHVQPRKYNSYESTNIPYKKQFKCFSIVVSIQLIFMLYMYGNVQGNYN